MYEQQTNATTPQPKLQQPKQPKTVSIEEWEDIVADKYQIPKGLWKAIPSQESGGKGWDAVSGTGVRGKYQVTEKTARAYGLDRNDPYQQVVAAARTLRDAYDSEKNESDEQKRWLRATGRYYFGDGAVDATGAISAKSRDGVSNPGAHLEKIAKYWGDYERRQKPQTVAEPVSAQPSPTPDPKAKTYYHPPDGEHRGFWTNYPLEPIVRTKEEEEAQAKVGQPHIWSGDETDDQGALTGRGMVIHKPEGVAMIEPPKITQRDRDAARLIRNIESQRKRALDLFKQADDLDRRAAAGNAEQNRQSAKTLREQADAELYKANLMATSAQERFGDIVEAGFGKDADPNSKRQWAYAKAKTPDMREKIDRIDLRQGEIGRREAAEKMQVTPEQKARFEKQREVERLRKEFEGQWLPARFAQRWLTAASGGLNPDEQVITQPVNTAEDVVNHIAGSAIRGAAGIPEGLARVVDRNLNRGDLAIATSLEKMLAAHPEWTPEEKQAAKARINEIYANQSAVGDQFEGLSRAGKQLAEQITPVDPTKQGSINPLNPNFYTVTLPEAAGSMLPFFAGGAAASAAKIPAALSSAVLGVGMSAPEQYQRAKKLGATPEQLARAVDTGTLAGLIEALGAKSLMGEVASAGKFVPRVVSEGAKEFGQETLQSGISDLGAKYHEQTEPNLTAKEMAQRAFEQGIPAAFLGAGGGIGSSGIAGRQAATTRAEQAPMPGIVPTMQGPTQITSLDPRAAKSIPRETTLPLAAPEVAAPVAEVAAQLGVQPEKAQQVVNQAVAEVEAETGQIPPEAFPLLPESEKAARMRQRAARSGMRDALPFEVRLNDDLNTAATLLQSPDAADRTEGQRILNTALREIQQSQGYLGEVQAQRGGQKIEATPYSATKTAIQSRLKGIEDAANRAKEAEKSQKEAGQRTEKLEKYAATAVQRGVIPPVDAIQRSFRMTPDEATAFQASIAGQIEGRASQTGALPQDAQTGQVPQGRPTDALPTATLPKSAKAVARAPFGEGYQPAIEQFTQGAQMAARSVEAGRFADARDAYKRQIEALKIARANTNRRTAEGAKEYGRLGTQIAGIERQIGDLRQAQREAAKQANAPTKGLANPATFSRPESAQAQAQQQDARNIPGDISAPLLRPEAIQNPEGGIPAMPEQTFSGRLQRGIERQQVEAAQGDTENLTIAGMLKRRFPEGIRIADRGEARNLGGREGNALVGLVNRNSRVGVDDVAYALHEEGLRLPDGRPFVEDGRVVVSESDVLGFIRSNGKQKVGGTKSLAKSLAEQEAEYDKQRQVGSEVAPTGELKTDASLEADEDAEAMASLQRTIERSETENPRPYAERTRPAEPGSSGVSFSPYTDMVANNKEKVDRLYQMNLTTPRAQAVINELRAYSIKNGIELRHLHALLDDIANTQIRDAGWRDRGVSPEAFALAEREKTLQYLGEQQAQTDRQLKRAIANAPLDQRERLELEVAAIDELATILRDDPDMMTLFDDAVTGAQPNVEDFVNAAGQAYGIAEDTARSLVDGQRQDYQSRQSNQRRAVPAQRKAATAQATARPKRGEFTAADENLLNQNPATVSDADFDAYLKRLEEIRNLNIYGEMFGGVDLLPSLARKVRVRIAQANEERHIRVMDKKLGAKHEKRYVPTLEERQEVFDLLERTIDEPQADRDRKVADLRKAQEARRNAKTTESVTPATTDRAIQHSQFGEVRVAADQSGVSKGKLRVIDGDGKSHEIQNPRTSGNRDAAFVKTQPKTANESAQSEVRQPAAKAGKSIDAQIKDIRDLQKLDLIEPAEAKRKIATLEAQRPKAREQKAATPASRAITDAKIQFKTGRRGQPGTLYANEPALDVLRAAYEEVFGRRVEISNVNLNSAASRRMAQVLMKAADDPDFAPDTQEKLQEISREFSFAWRSGRTVSIVSTAEGRKFSDIKVSRRHELFHDAQEGLENSSGFLAKHEYGKQLIEGLAHYNFEDRTVEAAAFLAGGQAKDFGLTDAQGKEFLADYFDDIVAVNGADALRRFVSMAPQVQDALKEARQKYDIQRKTGSNQRGARAEAASGRTGTTGEAARSSAGVSSQAQQPVETRSPRTRASVENSPEFKRWFGDSKVVDEDGKPLVVYHGTQSPTPINKIDLGRLDANAMYGPGFYTTQDYNVASGEGGYSSEKQAVLFNAPYHGSELVDWSDESKGYYVYDEKGDRVTEAGIFQTKDEAEKAAYEWARKDDPNRPHAYPLYLSIKNPFRMDGIISGSDVAKLLGGDGYSKIGHDLYESLFDQVGSKAEVNLLLQAAGFDGITHIGGQNQDRFSSKFANITDAQQEASRRGGNVKATKGGKYKASGHRVWIAFFPEQVKSAIGNRGTFEPENPRIAEQRPINRFSVGRVPEGRGAVLAGGLNIQGLFDRKPKADQSAPAKSKATVPLPKDFNATAWGEKFYRDAMAAALSRADRAEYDAAKTVREKNAVLLGADVDEKYEDKIYDLVDRVNDAVDKGDGAALRKVIQEASRMTREKQDSIRKNVFETIGAGQAAVQLATPGFVGRNILQHASSAIQSGLSDRLASAIDATFSAVTKTPRAIKETGNPVSQTLEGLRNYKRGLKEGWEKHKAGVDLGSGKLIDMEDLPTNKVANGFRELLFFINDLPDAGNYVARYERALKSLVKADERNKTPMTETRMAALVEQAKLEADHASLRDDNFISHALKHLKTTLNHITSPVTGTDRFGLGDFIVKYTQVPGALVKRSIEYSPLGLIEAGWRAQRAVRGIGSDFERRNAIQALSRAVTGTGSTLGMGAALFLTGILVPPEKDDYTSEQLERARGVRGFSVNLSALARLAPTLLNGEGFSAAMKVRDGDKLIPIDWVQPWAMGASVGATLAKDWKEGKLSSGSAAKASFRSLSNALEIMGDQSVLKNVREYLRAAKGKTFTEITGNVTEKFVKSAPQSFAPGITRQIGGVIDPSVRDYRPESRKGITNALKEGLTRTATGTLPGLSLRYPEKIDPITGKPMKTAQGERTVAQRILSLFSPQAINEYKADSLRDEIIRLNDYLEEKDISLYVPPLSSQQTKIKGYEEPTRLLRQRETEFAKEFAIRGRRLVESPRFAMLSDDKKADALRNLISDIRQKTYKSGAKTETLKPQYKQPAIRP